MRSLWSMWAICFLATVAAAQGLSWDGLEERFEAEGEAGFSGVVIVLRGGEVAFERAYGLAQEDPPVANTLETIFAIGSTPIDFTKAAVLLLAERGELDLEEPITDFFDDVPQDKIEMTVEHLMTGESGLLDFHGVPSDGNQDHAWIDRDEAVRRILGQKLLFAPGEGEAHSHSAWGLLAVIVELVSGQSYQEFTRENLFVPADMHSTGFFGERWPDRIVAVGRGDLSSGEINAPPYWGRASWLVLGSGGMVSTAGDMLRWEQALRAGKLLSEEWLPEYWSPAGGILSGGDSFGFEIIYNEDSEDMFFVITNAMTEEGLDHWQQLARDLARLVRRGR